MSTMKILDDIFREVQRAKQQHPKWPTDVIHAAGAITEEAGEVQKAANESVYEPHRGSRETLREDALHTAAVCFRFIESLDAKKYEFFHSYQHGQPADEDAPADGGGE